MITDILKTAGEEAIRDKSYIEPKLVDYVVGREDAPSDYEIDNWCKNNNINEDAAENLLFVYAKKYLDTLHKDGLYNKEKPFKVDPDQLKKGIEVEYEHTGDWTLARKIALDHLAEDKYYYTRLAKMEEKAKEPDKVAKDMGGANRAFGSEKLKKPVVVPYTAFEVEMPYGQPNKKLSGVLKHASYKTSLSSTGSETGVSTVLQGNEVHGERLNRNFLNAISEVMGMKPDKPPKPGTIKHKKQFEEYRI